MIKTYKDTLNIGDYGGDFLEYHETEIIGDVISYIAEASVGTYDWELWEWASNNAGWIEQAIDYGFYSIDASSFDLMDLFKAGQHMQVYDGLYNDVDDIIAYVVLEKLQDEFINKERLVEVIDDICYNIDSDRTVEYYIDIVKDTMEDYPMLEIHLLTGTAWTKSIIVEGTEYDDLLGLIDEYYLEHDELPVPMYTLDELLDGQLFKSQDEQWEYIDSLEMVPINGGEFYIEGIAHVEEVI